MLSHGGTPKSSIWVCLKIVYPMVNDHYPVFKWLFHWEYTIFFFLNPLVMINVAIENGHRNSGFSH